MNHLSQGSAQQQTQTYGIGLQNAMPPTPREPNIADRSKELLTYLLELDSLQASIRTKLFGPFPQGTNTLGQSNEEPSIETMIAVACERSACLVGEAKSILNRL